MFLLEASGLGRAEGALGRAGALLSRAKAVTRDVIGAARGRMERFVGRGASCMNSFTAGTLVATALGVVAIGSLQVGDQVLAFNEQTGVTGSYPVSAIHVNSDPVTGVVIINGEVIETTPEHPFFTSEGGWVDAEDLATGMHVPSSAGAAGTVERVDFSGARNTMFNLTVEDAHTFYVSHGRWLVHNTACPHPSLHRM